MGFDCSSLLTLLRYLYLAHSKTKDFLKIASYDSEARYGRMREDVIVPKKLQRQPPQFTANTQSLSFLLDFDECRVQYKVEYDAAGRSSQDEEKNQKFEEEFCRRSMSNSSVRLGGQS